MNTEILLAFLAFGTMGAIVMFGWRSAVATEERRRSDVKPSTLAADAPDSTDGKPVDT